MPPLPPITPELQIQLGKNSRFQIADSIISQENYNHDNLEYSLTRYLDTYIGRKPLFMKPVFLPTQPKSNMPSLNP